MNYYEIINKVKEVSTKHILVNEVKDGDVYEWLNSKNHKYPCVVITPQTLNTDNGSDTQTLNLVIFYIDRLTDTQENKLYIQSQGTTVLGQIIDKLGEDFELDNTTVTYTPFTEKFTDMCAGVYATFDLSYPIDYICSTDDEFDVKTLNITKNGKYDVTGYDEVIVNI